MYSHISNFNNRHVRLKKNFVNRETIPHVGVKLRIPEVLLVEKMRTQQRFNVSTAMTPGICFIYINTYFTPVQTLLFRNTHFFLPILSGAKADLTPN